MVRRKGARAIKAHRQYTYAEAASALGRTTATIRTWRNMGLRVLDGQRPHLIIGADLKAFLDARRGNSGGPLAADGFYCLRCRRSVPPMGGMVDYEPRTPSTGILKALCEACEGNFMKFSNRSQAEQLAQTLDIVFAHARQD